MKIAQMNKGGAHLFKSIGTTEGDSDTETESRVK
jgi:hypothetical protein